MVYWQAIAAIAGSLAVLVTAAGLWFVARQIRNGRKALKAQFISGLGNEIIEMYDVYCKLLPGGAWSRKGSGTLSNEDITRVVAYLGLFLRIGHLIELRAIDLPTVDCMFNYRFFLAMNNPNVQKHILFDRTKYGKNTWNELFAMYHKWREFREKRGFEVPFADHDLALFDPDEYARKIREAEHRAVCSGMDTK